MSHLPSPTQTVTLTLPDDLLQRARLIAAAGQRPVEDVLVDWLGRALGDDLEHLPDAAILALSEAELPAEDQSALSDLLAAQREGTLSDADALRLDNLMAAYRRGWVRKARALQIAVARGLRPPED
jgi:plasmid stability protein